MASLTVEISISASSSMETFDFLPETWMASSGHHRWIQSAFFYYPQGTLKDHLYLPAPSWVVQDFSSDLCDFSAVTWSDLYALPAVIASDLCALVTWSDPCDSLPQETWYDPCEIAP